jgi:hypothetical protein
MASLTFQPDGSLGNVDEEGDDLAFYNGNRVQFVSGSQLRQYAATVYAESANMNLLKQLGYSNPENEMKRETFAIAYTMFTYAMTRGAAEKKAGRFYGLNQLLTDSNYTKGIVSAGHNEYFSSGGDQTRRALATLAVIKLFNRDTSDVSDVISGLDKAMYWDGNDLFRLYQNHFRAKNGFELGDPAHGQLYKNIPTLYRQTVNQISSCVGTNPNVVKAGRQYTYLSTFTAGGTIFFKLHPQATSAGITW